MAQTRVQMNRRSLLTAASLSLLAIMPLTACGSDDEEASGPVTLDLVEYQQPRADAVAKLLPEFEAAMKSKGKTVKVNLVRDILPDDQFKTKITQQYVAGNAPDVADFGSSYVPGFAGAGYLLDLTPYLEKWADWGTFYPDIRQQIVQPDGRVYNLPHEANTQSLFYRKDVLQKLGVPIEQPKSWPELMDRLKQIKAKTGQPAIVLPAGTTWGDGTFGEGFLNVMLGTGSPLYDTKDQKWVVRSKGLTDTFTIYSDLVRNGLLPVNALQNPEPWQPTKYVAFPKGTLPVSAQGTWGWRYDWGPEGSAPIPDVQDKVATWNYPASDGSTYSVSSVAFGYSVSAKTEHPDEAVELAQWLSTGKAMAEQLVAVGAAAPRSGISTVAPYSKQPTLLATEKELPNARSFPPRPGQDQIAQAVGQATEGILAGRLDGPGAAEDFAAKATELLGADKVKAEG
jgi:multiple sugar transport system substrate-binding protein